MASLLDLLESEIAMEQDREFSTEIIPCPTGNRIGSISKVTRRKFVSDKGDTSFMLSLQWLIDDEEAREECKSDKVYVEQAIFLNLDEAKSINLEDDDADQQVWVITFDGNPAFGKFMKWLKSDGYIQPAGWVAFWVGFAEEVIGKEALLDVTHSLRKTKELDEEGNPVMVVRANVKALAKV